MFFDRDFFNERAAMRRIARGIVARARAPLSPSPNSAPGAAAVSSLAGASSTQRTALYNVDKYNDGAVYGRENGA